ncbi:outer dynein arm-docking complex subunit 4-like isoform X2 [Epargyreus clarus]|uniref:outer dynein arm-docking complex subunit 4-like isoform X2 n=1 Tax=Epargyreus clarus TaxID=520877 RepID=UPI003C2C88F5
MRKKLVPEERPICNVVTVYRSRGNYLQRLEQFEKAILAYNEALRWNIRECAGASAEKVLSATAKLLRSNRLKEYTIDSDAPKIPLRKSRFQPQLTHQVQEISRVEKQKSERISRLMASKYLEQMAHDKHFLTALCKDERLASANKLGSQRLYELANKALADVEKRQTVLRERRPLYAARASEDAARSRLFQARKERINHAQKQHVTDAKRLVKAAEDMLKTRDTAKCLELAEFGIEQISRKPSNLLPGKENFLQALHDIVANAFLDQKRVRDQMSEADLEKRAFVLLGIAISREPSRDSVLRSRPPAPPRDAKRRLRTLERALSVSGRASERCYVMHELSRLHAETKQAHRARFYALKCQSEARNADQRTWLLNATFLLARCHLLQNNRPEARAALIEGAALARSFRYMDIASFFDTCVNVSMEGEIASTEATLEKREKAMVSLMQDDDLRMAAEHLFRRMSVIPVSRRFSVMPGARTETVPPIGANRRASIVPRTLQPARISHKTNRTLGYQDFDF